MPLARCARGVYSVGRDDGDAQMTGQRDWQGRTGQAWAEEWRRTDRFFTGVTERLMARSRDFAFSDALDIGCGAGELSLALARGRPGVRVVGVDISPELIEAARERGGNLLNAEFAVADAGVWVPDDGFTPDLLVSRHGVMFFDDPVSAFTHLGTIAAPDASLLFSCFRERAVNEQFDLLGKLLPPAAAPPDPHAPGPLAFADPEHVSAILGAAGWSRIAFEPVDFATVVGAGEDPLADAMEYFAAIGPLAEAARGMAPGERQELFGRLRDKLAARVIDGVIALRAGAWIVSATRA